MHLDRFLHLDAEITPTANEDPPHSPFKGCQA